MAVWQCILLIKDGWFFSNFSIVAVDGIPNDIVQSFINIELKKTENNMSISSVKSENWSNVPKMIRPWVKKSLLWLPIDLHLMFEKSSLKNQVGFLSISNFIFSTCKIQVRYKPYPSVLDFWKIKLEKSSSTNWIFTACVAWKKSISNL